MNNEEWELIDISKDFQMEFNNSEKFLNINIVLEYINTILNKSLTNNIIKIVTNPSMYMMLATSITAISSNITTKFCNIYNIYYVLLDKTIQDKTVNFFYPKAYEIAILQLMNECINECVPFIINLNLKSKKNMNFSETVTINIANDILLITIKNISYVFSKYYLLNSIFFQNKIIEVIQNIIPTATINFINGTVEGSTTPNFVGSYTLEGAYYIIINNNVNI
jgi:hypothetical protein